MDKLLGAEDDTEGTCFLCMDLTSNPPKINSVFNGLDKPAIHTHSIRCLYTFLNIDAQIVFSGEHSKNNAGSKVDLCHSCGPLIKTFSRLYRQLEKVEMEMEANLNQIHQKLSTSGNVLRVETRNKCSQKLQLLAQSRPRVKIRRLTTIPDLSEVESDDGELQLQITNIRGVHDQPDLSLSSDSCGGDADDEDYHPSHTEIDIGAVTVKMDNAMDYAVPVAGSNSDDDDQSSEPFLEGIEEKKVAPETNSPPQGKRGPKRKMPWIKNKKTGKVKCKICSKEFTKYIQFYWHHQKEHHKKISPPLKRVKKVGRHNNSSKPASLTRSPRGGESVRNKPFPGSSINPQNGKHKCDICSKEFNDKYLFQGHHDSEHLHVRYKCNFCGKEFKTLGNQKRHRLIAHVGVSCKCHKCNKTFKHADYLRKHLRNKNCFRVTYTPAQHKVRCPICGQGFTAKSMLQIHTDAVHLQLRTHECDICGLKFRRKTYLPTHKRLVHPETLSPIKAETVRNKRPQLRLNPETGKYKCIFCGMHYARKYNLQVHQSTAAGCGGRSSKKRFPCRYTDCESTFTRKDSLQHHLKAVHEQERPFGCDTCGDRFKRKETFNYHRRNVNCGSGLKK